MLRQLLTDIGYDKLINGINWETTTDPNTMKCEASKIVEMMDWVDTTDYLNKNIYHVPITVFNYLKLDNLIPDTIYL